MHAVFTRKHVFVLLNIWEKGWKVATEDFVLFILFAIGKKFSFPTFFRLQYCELVTQQLRVCDGCFHTNYIAWQLKLNHWLCSYWKIQSYHYRHSTIEFAETKIACNLYYILIKIHSRNLFNLITVGTPPLNKNLCYLQHRIVITLISIKNLIISNNINFKRQWLLQMVNDYCKI